MVIKTMVGKWVNEASAHLVTRRARWCLRLGSLRIASRIGSRLVSLVLSNFTLIAVDFEPFFGFIHKLRLASLILLRTHTLFQTKSYTISFRKQSAICKSTSSFRLSDRMYVM